MSHRKRCKKAKTRKAGSRGRRAGREKQARLQSNKEHLARLLDWLLPSDTIFASMRLHGNTKWLPRALVCLALMWAWSELKCLTDAFVEAEECCRSVLGGPVIDTYQGFMRALTHWTPTLMEILWPVLHRRMEQIGGRFWRVAGWIPIAFDGSRSTAPRTKANEKAFCAKDYGKGKTAKYRKKKSKGMRRRKNQRNKAQPQEPQAWITLLWHMGLRLPWMWRLGPSNASERAHVMEMIEAGEYPKNTLFCGDAGFVGFPLWSAIVRKGHDFLVRVGANVTLLLESTDYELHAEGKVLCWPKNMQGQQPPLRLRLVKVRIGKNDAYLLTSVLDPKKLNRRQMVQFYKMRWGVEVEFRGLKQTLDRAKLRCANDQRLLAELHWSLMAMAVAELLALQAQLTQKTKKRSRREAPLLAGDPSRRSLASTMRAIRRCLRAPDAIPEAGADLPTRLRAAVTDGYRRERSKHARYRPPNPDKKPLGAPKLHVLTDEEKKRLRRRNETVAA
jgi:hypothetical protein